MFAQTAFHNSGNVQIHDQGQIGFHIDLINNGMFNQNLGLAGFYNSNNSLTISGTQIPRFFDMEVAVDNNLFLEVNTEVSNGLNFIIGNVITPRINPTISLDFLEDSFYVSENDLRLTDGYASFNGNASFSFPIGDDSKLRPLITPQQTNTSNFKAAYYNEDPNFPSIFTQSFNTSNSEGIISTISTQEFWDFNGTSNTSITLTWDSQSLISQLTTTLDKLRVVGWNNIENRWDDLGNTNFTGDINEGTLSSEVFNPKDYDVLTFGSLINESGVIVYDIVTPNGDGENDFFTIEGIELFENKLEIFNRWGLKVFEATNYSNTFDGLSNGRSTFSKKDRLPVGTYYYVLELTKSGKQQAGPLYITY